MKKTAATSIILTLLILNSLAQPNSGFENWTPEASYENPDGWATLNFLSLLSPPNPLSAFKAVGLDKHSGNYALKIQTIAINNNPNPSLIGDTVSGIFTGKINLSPFTYTYGFPYTGRPEKLEFWAKYEPVGNDTAEILVILKKWNGIAVDSIAQGRLSIPATPAYNLFKVNFVYYSTAIPDTASIVFGASKYKSGPEVGSTLYLDDIGFTGWVGIDEKNQLNNKVKIFPNPASENLTIVTEMEEAENVKITDISGKKIGWFKIQNSNATINTTLFAEGTYFYEVVDKKEKILTKGKFSVVK